MGESLKLRLYFHYFLDGVDGDEDDVGSDPEEDGLEDEDELEDEFDEYGHSLHHHSGYNTRIITTVPAKEPVMNAVPLKSALKKPKNGGSVASNGMVASVATSSRNDKGSSDHSSSSSRYALFFPKGIRPER